MRINLDAPKKSKKYHVGKGNLLKERIKPFESHHEEAVSTTKQLKELREVLDLQAEEIKKLKKKNG